MAETETKKWVVGLQPVQGGEVRQIRFDWTGTPTLEDAAGMAMPQLEETPLAAPLLPKGDRSPNQTALKARGYEIVGLSEVSPLV